MEENIRKKRSLKLIISAILASVVVVFAVCFGSYFYFKYKKLALNSDVAVKNEVRIMTEKIGKFMELPQEDEPSVATVSDTEKLKGQAFFSNAQNGDKVLIYGKSGKAILYRPSENKVIEISSSLSVSGSEHNSAQESNLQTQNVKDQQPASQLLEQQQTVSEQEEPENIKVAVYNGTDIKGLAQKVVDKISVIPSIEIVGKTNAAENYAETIIVDLNGKNSEMVKKIMEIIGGKEGTLPEGEVKPDADILIIGGEK